MIAASSASDAKRCNHAVGDNAGELGEGGALGGGAFTPDRLIHRPAGSSSGTADGHERCLRRTTRVPPLTDGRVMTLPATGTGAVGGIGWACDRRPIDPDDMAHPPTTVESVLAWPWSVEVAEVAKTFGPIGLLTLIILLMGCQSSKPQPGRVPVSTQTVAHRAASPSPGETAVRPDNAAIPIGPEITLAQAIAHSLRHSGVVRDAGGVVLATRVLDGPDSVATGFDPEIAAADPFYGPAAALSQFDRQLFATASHQNNDRVFNSAVVGGGATQLTQDLATLTAGVQRRGRSGGVTQLSWSTEHDANNRFANLFPSSWQTQAEISIRQPLARGAGRTFNDIAGPVAQPGFYFSNGIRVAQINTQISAAEFDQAMRRHELSVTRAYWRLWTAGQSATAAAEAFTAARRAFLIVDARAASGLGGGEAATLAAAKSEMLRRRVDSIEADGQVGQAGRELAQIISRPVGRSLRAAEPPAAAAVKFDPDAVVSRAIAVRPELIAGRLRVQKLRLQSIAARNFLLPQLDVIAAHRIRGFGDDLAGGGGGIFDNAADDFWSLDHQETEFGIEYRQTAGRRQAHAAVRHAGLQVRRAEAVLRQAERQVAFEITDAIARADVAWSAAEAADRALRAANDRIEAATAAFTGGVTSLQPVTDAIAAKAEAAVSLASRQAAYAEAIAEVQIAGCLD